MNSPYPSDSSFSAAVAADTPQASRQAPSVPISVYRELATELQATQGLVDSLTQQNQQLSQQNQHLRQEMLRFADAAQQLRQAIDSSQPASPDPRASVSQLVTITGTDEMALGQDAANSLPERLSESLGDGVSGLANQFGKMVKPKPMAKSPRAGAKGQGRPAAKRPQPAPPPQRLYTEERLEPSRSTQPSGKTTDFSGLWLATTILLIVVTAFGAGFLIMKPLLNSNTR